MTGQIVRSLAAALLVATVLAVVESAAFAATPWLRGTITISSSKSADELANNGFPPSRTVAGSACSGTMIDYGFSDIGQGTELIVNAGKNHPVAVTNLTAGQYDAAGACVFQFSVKVPDAPSYSFQLSKRRLHTYSRTKVAGLHWRVAFTLKN